MLTKLATAIFFTIAVTLVGVEVSARFGAVPSAPDSIWIAEWIPG